MKKKLFLLTTFLISFVMFAGNVRAEEDEIKVSCLYDGNKSGLFKVQGKTLITQKESGDVNVYYTKEAFSDNYDLYNYPIASPIFYNTKREDGDKLVRTYEDEISDQLKEKGCPKYVDYNGGTVKYTYDEPAEGDSFRSYYPLISEEIQRKVVPSKELKCEYPKLAFQEEFIIIQSKDGEITTTYDGEDKKVNFSNDESNTGYNVKTGKFDNCPLCVNVHNDYADFYNGESDASCKDSYSGLIDSNNTDWKFTCVYGTADEYAAYKKITLSYNENNFETTFETSNPNLDPSKIQEKFIAAQLWKSNSNSCPSHLKLYFVPQSDLVYLYLDNNRGVHYALISSPSNGDTSSTEPVPEPKNCKELFTDDILEIINDVMNVIRIAVPILLLVFGITDFFRATFDTNEDNMKKNRDRFIKRVIAAIIVFIVPIFVNLVLKLANIVWDDINRETCIDVEE